MLYKVDFGLTILFRRIYGEPEYYSFKENATLPDFKRQFKKLLKTIENGFKNSSIQTDNFHKSEIYELINSEITSIEKTKTIKILYNSLICFYTELAFLILGMMPENASYPRKITNNKRWKLNKFRQIRYSQTREQKIEQLKSIIQNKRIPGLPKAKETRSLYEKERQKGEDILYWLKRTRPDIYLKMFEYE